MVKFTFKKEPKETGLRAVGHPHASTTVKLNKKECGIIQAPSWSTKDSLWRVGLMVMDNGSNPNNDWQWVFFRQCFPTEPEAREWLQANAERLSKKYKIRCADDNE